MPRIGVLLSGCGVFDGAEIQEAVFTLLALDQRGATAVCCAPDVDQADVIDHRTQQPQRETRNVLREAARIARGQIRDLATVRAAELDGLILPGGYGAAKNLSDFATKGATCSVHPEVARLLGECLVQRKPIGAICIAPAVIARIARQRNVPALLTIGNDAGTAAAIVALGCRHAERAVDEIAVDPEQQIVSTPAYMLGPSPAPVFAGIVRLVEEVLTLAAQRS